VTGTIIVLAVLALVLWGFYVSWRASRLDRLHNRVEAARTALDLALVRRASAATELASSGQLDPATSLLLADAVRRARQADQAERDLAESDLTRALRATLGDPDFREELIGDDGAAELVAEVEAAAQQVFIARKFYNDLAGRTIDARRRPLAHVLHLSGSAKQPAFFDMDDEILLRPITQLARAGPRAWHAAWGDISLGVITLRAVRFSHVHR
jgi:hypothetical protein